MDYISEFVKGGVSMHAYMKAVGFSAISSRKEMQKLIEDVIRNSDRRKVWFHPAYCLHSFPEHGKVCFETPLPEKTCPSVPESEIGRAHV